MLRRLRVSVLGAPSLSFVFRRIFLRYVVRTGFAQCFLYIGNTRRELTPGNLVGFNVLFTACSCLLFPSSSSQPFSYLLSIIHKTYHFACSYFAEPSDN
jgi:hypothetical protein